MTGEDGKHKIMEAGEHCDANMQPHLYGMVMEMVREQTCGGSESYQENVSEIEMRLLHPKLTLNTDVMIETGSPVGSESSSSGSNYVTTTLPVIFLPSLLFLLRSL